MSPNHYTEERLEHGRWEAIKGLVHRRRAFVGYLLLTGGVVLALATEREHSNQNRAELARSTQTVLIAGCERQNTLRLTLQDILRTGEAQTKRLVQDGTLTPEQADRATAVSEHAIATLAPTDCATVYPLGNH